MLNDIHSELLAVSLNKLLGKATEGSVAFIRCLDPVIVRQLCASPAFNLKHWKCYGVVNAEDIRNSLITADRAVEIREDKKDAVLLLIDVNAAGAGMDGIYNAGREIFEKDLFNFANKAAQKNIDHGWRTFAKKAVAKARRIGGRKTVSPWQEFDFYSCCTDAMAISKALVKIGIWPIQFDQKPAIDDLNISIRMVEQLFLHTRSSAIAETRVESLMMQNPTKQQTDDLLEVVRESAGISFMEAVVKLSEMPHLWVNELKPFPSDAIQKIEIVSWRGNSGKPLKWSGLVLEDGEEKWLKFILDPDVTGRNQSKMEVRWNGLPDSLLKGTVEYSVAIMSGEDTLAEKTLSHSGKNPQKCFFILDDFELDEGEKFEAIVRIRSFGNEDIDATTEDFKLNFGNTPEISRSTSGVIVRSLAEAAIKIENSQNFESACQDDRNYGRDAKGYITFRYQDDETKKVLCSAKMYCPDLIRAIEEDWGGVCNGAIGRWFVQVRTDGSIAGTPEFMPYLGSITERLKRASANCARLALKVQGITGMIHAMQKSEPEDEYILAWQKELESGLPELALQNTLEVRSLSGLTIGLIVLPFHALRFAWHYGYDQLLVYSRYENGISPSKTQEIVKMLDSAHFPAFLPGFNADESFVFADILGLHAVAMVSDKDKEPKASVAILAKVLSREKEEIAPSIGKTTSDILATEINRYLALHPNYSMVNLHALRPGDGLTIGRALGTVLKMQVQGALNNDEDAVEFGNHEVGFVLELFPSALRQDVCGRFFRAISERRRSGAGSLSDADRWMLETYQRDGDVSIPKLCWAKRNHEQPQTSAHMSVAFDTFDSGVIPVAATELESTAPLEVFGLAVNLVKRFSMQPQPIWQSYLSSSQEGEKHPVARSISDRIHKLHSALMKVTAANLGKADCWPTLQTEMTADKEESIRALHRLSDWVITIDRNAGVEYFDSPNEKSAIYDAYIIDCVPEREGLGFLQMVTSTSNFNEVQKLLDGSLMEMGLSSSPRNCIFFLNELKALSGRFAMRLSGVGNQSPEMIALAMTHAICSNAEPEDECWLSLKEGFFIPIDDVPELIETVKGDADKEKSRADLLYVTVPQKGIGFRFDFVEVKFRRYLKSARSNDLLETITRQIQASRKNWDHLYGKDTTHIEKVVRRSWLSRILKFYAAKGRRHFLCDDAYQRIIREINKMVREGKTYDFHDLRIQNANDRGYVFCPEYSADVACKISYHGQPAIFLFGASETPDPPVRKTSQPIEEHMNNILNSTQILPSSTKIFLPEERHEVISSDTCCPVENKSSGASSVLQVPQNATITETTSRSVEVTIRLGNDLSNDEVVKWNISIKANPHLLIVGLPGMGKTTSLINICLQMMESGICPIVFSYHNDIDEILVGKLGDNVQYVDYGGLGYNPLKVISDNPIGYIDNISMLRDIFASIFTDLGDIQLGRIREALKQSYLDKGWGDVGKDRDCLEFPEFQSFYDYLQATNKKDKVDKGVLTRLDELNDYGFFQKALSEVQCLLETSKLVIIRIHKTQNEVLQQAFASFILHNLYQQMFSRGVQQKISHAIIFDEAHRAAKLKLIPAMAKECRKFGVAFVLASQEAKDFDPSVFNAVANYLTLRVNEADAKVMAKIMASSEQVNRFTDRIKQLPKYHAFFFGEGRNRAANVQLDG